MEKNINIIEMANEMSKIIEQHISYWNINANEEGNFYYIQSCEENAPMIINHYCGSFCVLMHPEDYKKICNGEVLPHDYINSANWQIGYLWDNGSMFGGGYYQPMDIIKKQDKVRRYFKILFCRGRNKASGYMPDEKTCEACSVENCPFSEYKDGNWEKEIEEYDPRKDFFNAIAQMFEEMFEGYKLINFKCARKIEDDTIFLYPCGHYSEEEPLSFLAWVSEKTIRDLMMRKVVPENWEEYANSFKFKIKKNGESFDATEEYIKKLSYEADYVAQRKVKKEEVTCKKRGRASNRIYEFFRKLF